MFDESKITPAIEAKAEDLVDKRGYSYDQAYRELGIPEITKPKVAKAVAPVALQATVEVNPYQGVKPVEVPGRNGNSTGQNPWNAPIPQAEREATWAQMTPEEQTSREQAYAPETVQAARDLYEKTRAEQAGK